MTIFQDQVARVDLTADRDGDVEIATWFREGNRWIMLEAAPTVASPTALLAGMVELGLLKIGEPRQQVELIRAMARTMPKGPGRDSLEQAADLYERLQQVVDYIEQLHAAAENRAERT